MSLVGTNVQQPTGFKAFIPAPFPPSALLQIDQNMQVKHSEAMITLGRLDGISRLLPNKDFFILMFIRKDAASSSQIEGTNASLDESIEAQTIERPTDLPDDVSDILHYIDALNHGIKRLSDLPLSLRLLLEVHKELMTDARKTQHAFPGEFRRTQNWIGGTSPGNARFVPPPVHEMNRALDELEKFIYDEAPVLPLIKAGLLHSQFETIHPFTDGNGRTGRMMVTLYLTQTGRLEIPVLYLSSFFKKHQDRYYEVLNSYHSDSGSPSEWLDFFLDGVIETAESAIATCHKITELRLEDLAKVQSLGKSSAESTVKMLQNLYSLPIIGLAEVMNWTGYSKQGAYNVIERLVGLGILSPRGSKDYAQKYGYKRYLDIFTEDNDGQS
jgi:cell filamentation protein, protein adenylyltransferase